MPKDAELSQSFVDAVNQDSDSTESKELLADMVINFNLTSLGLCKDVSVDARVDVKSKAKKKQDYATDLQQQEQRYFERESKDQEGDKNPDKPLLMRPDSGDGCIQPKAILLEKGLPWTNITPEIDYDAEKANGLFTTTSRYGATIPLPRAGLKVFSIINVGDSKYVNVVSSSFNHDEKSIEREDLLKLIIKEKQGLNNNFHELQNVRQIKVWDYGSSIFTHKNSSSLFSALICPPLNEKDECTKLLIAVDLAFANSLAVEFNTGKQLLGIELRAAKLATRMLFEAAIETIRTANIMYLGFAAEPEAIAARNILLNPDNIDEIVNLLFAPDATKHKEIFGQPLQTAPDNVAPAPGQISKMTLLTMRPQLQHPHHLQRHLCQIPSQTTLLYLLGA